MVTQWVARGGAIVRAWWHDYWHFKGVFLWFISQAWFGSNWGSWQGVRVVALITQVD